MEVCWTSDAGVIRKEDRNVGGVPSGSQNKVSEAARSSAGRGKGGVGEAAADVVVMRCGVLACVFG